MNHNYSNNQLSIVTIISCKSLFIPLFGCLVNLEILWESTAHVPGISSSWPIEQNKKAEGRCVFHPLMMFHQPSNKIDHWSAILNLARHVVIRIWPNYFNSYLASLVS